MSFAIKKPEVDAQHEQYERTKPHPNPDRMLYHVHCAPNIASAPAREQPLDSAGQMIRVSFWKMMDAYRLGALFISRMMSSTASIKS
jgi:hypothetical protein